ncbi:MAG: LuxR C-terminal-related transcriptional regulator [Gaiellaceae bacterium]
MDTAVAGLVGREEELALARAVRTEGAGGVVVFRGAAGIGKTTAWEAAVAEAAADGLRILEARPVEAERSLGFSALADLLEPVADEALPELPRPQRRALEAALLRRDDASSPPDVRTLGAALVGSLRVAGADHAVMVAVDDFQWADPASRSVIGFALRRLSHVPAAAMLAIRPSGARDRLPEFDRASTVRVIELEGLSLGAMRRLLKERLGVDLSRVVLRRVHDASGGNPLYALEIVRALAEHDFDLSAAEELPLPRGLEPLLHERLASLPPQSRLALAAAAMLAAPRADLVEGEGDLQPALDAGVVRIDGELVRFSHPLLASTAVAALTPKRRRNLHGRLASVVEDLEQQARHLALAHPGKAEPVSRRLELAAHRAFARGAPAAAGELLLLAIERAADESRLPKLRLAACRAFTNAGDARAAREIAEESVSELPPGADRAKVLTMLSKLTRDDLPVAVELARQAFAEAAGDPSNEAEAAAVWSRLSGLSGDLPTARDLARLALARADVVPEETQVAVISTVAMIELWATGRADPGLLARGVALEERGGRLVDGPPVRTVAATQLFLEQRHTEARRLLEELNADLEALGDERGLIEGLNHLAMVETAAGRPSVAAVHAARAAEMRDQSGSAQGRFLLAFFAAFAAAHLGQVDKARDLGEKGLAASAAAGDAGATIQHRAALGFLELSLGDAAAAVEVLRPAAELIAAECPGLHPAHVPVLPNLVEASVQVGRLEDAKTFLERLEERARALDSPWVRSQAARGRGLVAAAEGDLAKALARLEEAHIEQERLEGPFELGRTLLATGSVLRRSRRWRAARESLTAALAIFDAVEAPLWAEKARLELSRIGGRKAASGLTPTEERIARLVAEGRSNKEIAGDLFVAVRTVETHLTAVYAKLGVRSRTELVRALSA